MPERPPDTTELTAIQVLDGVPGLRLADRDWRALVAMRHPVKVALWLAMMRPAQELMDRESLTESVRSSPENREQRTGHSTTPSDPVTPNPEIQPIPAVIAWAEAAVRKGIRGDMQAWAQVADRIEGKAGTRADDVDPENERRRGDIQSVIEAVVLGLVKAKLNGPDDDSIDVTPINTSTHDGDMTQHDVDNERQDRDTGRRAELAEAAQRETQDNQARGESLVETNDSPEERDLTDPLEGPLIVHPPQGRTNGHG